MSSAQALTRACVVISLALGGAGAVTGQPAAGPIGGPFTGPVLPGLPITAESTAVLTDTPTGGTHRVESRLFRDSAGRVRLEQTIPGAGSASTPAVFAVVHTDAGSPLVHVLDPATRTFRVNGRSMYSTGFGGLGLTLAMSPVRYRHYQVHEWRHGDLRLPGYERASGIAEEALGTKHLEGVTVVGRRITATVMSSGQANGGTVDVVDEVWESPELRLVISSRTSDPRSGVLEYRVTKIRRTEPSARLFEVPADYLNRPKTKDEAYEFLYEPAVASRPDRRPGGR